jgi:hypothetical protein
MNNKPIIYCFLSILLIIFSDASVARRSVANRDVNLFLGVGANYAKFEIADAILQGNPTATVDDTQPGLAVYGGWFMTDMFAAEVGYVNYQRIRIGTNHINIQNLYGELQAYPKMNRNLNVIGTLGFGRMSGKTGIRVGGGIDFRMNEHFNIRGLIQYQNLSFGGNVSNATIASLGLTYHFNYY